MGILGLQTSLPVSMKLIDDGVLSRARAIELMTSGPASCFNLDYGTLQKGRPADICLLDPNKEWTLDKKGIESKSKNSPFIGMQLKGMVETVLVNGKICLENSEIVNE